MVKTETVHRVKYPTIASLPWSENNKNNLTLLKMDGYFNKKIIITKLNNRPPISIYSDGYVHGVSTITTPIYKEQYNDLLKEVYSELEEGWRVCGYLTKQKKAFITIDSIWNNKNECLSWEDTVEWCEILGLELPEILYKGIYNKEELLYVQLFKIIEGLDYGYLIRSSEKIHYAEFAYKVAKFEFGGKKTIFEY